MHILYRLLFRYNNCIFITFSFDNNILQYTIQWILPARTVASTSGEHEEEGHKGKIMKGRGTRGRSWRGGVKFRILYAYQPLWKVFNSDLRFHILNSQGTQLQVQQTSQSLSVSVSLHLTPVQYIVHVHKLLVCNDSIHNLTLCPTDIMRTWENVMRKCGHVPAHGLK